METQSKIRDPVTMPEKLRSLPPIELDHGQVNRLIRREPWMYSIPLMIHLYSANAPLILFNLILILIINLNPAMMDVKRLTGSRNVKKA